HAGTASLHRRSQIAPCAGCHPPPMRVQLPESPSPARKSPHPLKPACDSDCWEPEPEFCTEGKTRSRQRSLQPAWVVEARDSLRLPACSLFVHTIATQM